MFILITNLECRLVPSSLRSLIIAVSWDTVECPSPDKVEHSDSRLTDELPFTSAEKVQKNCTGGVFHVTRTEQTLQQLQNCTDRKTILVHSSSFL